MSEWMVDCQPACQDEWMDGWINEWMDEDDVINTQSFIPHKPHRNMITL